MSAMRTASTDAWAGLRLLLLALLCAPAPWTSAHAQQVPLRTFIERIYVHGFPVEEARRYGSQAVPELIDMLRGGEPDIYRQNVVFALGSVGGRSAALALIQYVESGQGTVSMAEYHAKSNALAALGYIVNRTGDATALAYLRSAVRPERWLERPVSWRSPVRRTSARINAALVRKAIIGLAMTGRPEADEEIRAAAASPALDAASRREIARLVPAALQARADIARKGLVPYLQP